MVVLGGFQGAGSFDASLKPSATTLRYGLCVAGSGLTAQSLITVAGAALELRSKYPNIGLRSPNFPFKLLLGIRIDSATNTSNSET